jgi:plasmid stabilization system protein ParE
MGSQEVEFHEAASLEFEAAFAWYLERSERAALRFALEVERAGTSIAHAPERFPAGVRSTVDSCCTVFRSQLFTANFLV